jgi:hypothetical protein
LGAKQRVVYRHFGPKGHQKGTLKEDKLPNAALATVKSNKRKKRGKRVVQINEKNEGRVFQNGNV